MGREEAERAVDLLAIDASHRCLLLLLIGASLIAALVFCCVLQRSAPALESPKTSRPSTLCTAHTCVGSRAASCSRTRFLRDLGGRARQVDIFTRLLDHKRVQARGRDSLGTWHYKTRVAVRCRAVLKTWLNRNHERQLFQAYMTWRQQGARSRVLRRMLLRLGSRTKFAAFAAWTARARDAVRMRRVCHRQESLVVASWHSL